MTYTKLFRIFCILLCLLLLSGCGVDTPQPSSTAALTATTTEDKGTAATAPTTVPPTTVAPTTVPLATDVPAMETFPAVNPGSLLVETVTTIGSCWTPVEMSKDWYEKPSPNQLGKDPTYEERLVFYHNLLHSWYSRFRYDKYSSTKEINIAQLLSLGIDRDSYVSNDPNDPEAAWLISQGVDMKYDWIRLPVAQIPTVLRDYFALEPEDYTIPDYYKYNPETDCYYTLSANATAGRYLGIFSVKALDNGDVCVCYAEEIPTGGVYAVELVMRPVGDHYQAVSNLIIAEGT